MLPVPAVVRTTLMAAAVLGWLASPFAAAAAQALPAAPAPARATLVAAEAAAVDTSSLAALINAYRARHGLPPIPVSPSLTAVALAHVGDLEQNGADHGSCNLHSWSDRGRWTAACYTDDGSRAPAMWDKPAQITGGVYTGNGYEIAAWRLPGISASRAFELWMSNRAHRAVILSRGPWSHARWRALGVAVSDHYAVAWFGTIPDPALAEQ